MSIEIHINKAVFFLFKKLEIVAYEVRFLLVTITHIFTASTLFSAHVENARSSKICPIPVHNDPIKSPMIITLMFNCRGPNAS